MNIETMRLLVAKGLSAEDILEVAESLGKPSRSAGAARQARYRARLKGDDDGVTGDVTSDGNGVTNDPSLSPSPLPSPQTPQPTPHPHTHPEQTPRARKADDFPCPQWAETAVWADLKRNRKTKRLTNTATAHTQFVAAIEAMADEDWPPGKLLKAIVAKGWGGAHDPRDDRKPANDRTQRPQHQRETTRQTGERVAARHAAAGGGPAYLLPGPCSPGGDA